MLKTITVQEAKGALQYLKTLTPANPKMDDDLEISVKESIAFMAPDLLRLSKRGFTQKELASGLNACGIAVKPGTLNRYLNEHLAASNGLAEPDSATRTATAEAGNPESKIRNGAAKNPKPEVQVASGKSDPAIAKQEQTHV